MEEGATPALTQAEAQVKAETFLSALCGGRWSALTLYDGRDNTEDRRPYYTFTYVQQVGGIPFPENRYTVAIDSGDGSCLLYTSRGIGRWLRRSWRICCF